MEPTVSAGETGARFCNRTGPVSIPLSGQKMVTPVSASPLMMAQLMALRPLCRGSRDGWNWMEP